MLCGSGEETQGSNGMEDTHEGKVTATEDMLTTTTPTPILPRLEEKRRDSSDHDPTQSINAKLVVEKREFC